MNVHDYLIDQSGLDWAQLLSSWRWLVPPEFSVWLMNRFGDLFLTLPDGSIHMLDVGGGSLTKLAESRDEFSRVIDEDGNADAWLMIPLVDQLVTTGRVLEPGQCFSFVTPPILDGEYSVKNTMIVPISEQFGLYASYHEQLRGVPDGTKVVIKIQKPPEESQIHGGK
jgi:hypothetical protein